MLLVWTVEVMCKARVFFFGWKMDDGPLWSAPLTVNASEGKVGNEGVSE